MRTVSLEVAEEIPPEKIDRVVRVLRETLSEDGKFAVLRLPENFPDSLMPALLTGTRALAETLLLPALTEQGVSE
jgi:hypothetical protein